MSSSQNCERRKSKSGLFALKVSATDRPPILLDKFKLLERMMATERRGSERLPPRAARTLEGYQISIAVLVIVAMMSIAPVVTVVLVPITIVLIAIAVV